MTHFKSSQNKGSIDINDDEKNSDDVRIMKLDSQEKPSISEFQFRKIKVSGTGDYQAVKRKFGPLASTDLDHQSRPGKDSRFKLNPLLREPLSIEEEEKRVIEEKVRARISALTDEAKENAIAAGHAEGFKKGYEEAFQKYQEDGAEKISRFDKFLQECEFAKFDIFRANEKFLIEIIYRVARQVMLKELAVDKDYVLRLSKELIEKVGVRENITLRVNDTDFAGAKELKDGLEASLGVLKNLNIEVTNLVQSGGCLIETEWNAIDAAIETQMQSLKETLLGSKGLSEGS